MLASHWYLGHLLIFSALCTHGYNAIVCCIPSVSFCYSPCTCRCGSFTSFTLGDPFSLCHILLFFFLRWRAFSLTWSWGPRPCSWACTRTLTGRSFCGVIYTMWVYPTHICPIVFCFITSGFRPLATFFCNMWMSPSWLKFFPEHLSIELLQTVSFSPKY